jgi:hypothetical protein
MFRFTIRELVLLTLVVAMGVAWWLERQSRQSLSLTVAELERELAYRAFVLNDKYPQWNKPDSIPRAMFNQVWEGKPLAP